MALLFQRRVSLNTIRSSVESRRCANLAMVNRYTSHSKPTPSTEICRQDDFVSPCLYETFQLLVERPKLGGMHQEAQFGCGVLRHPASTLARALLIELYGGASSYLCTCCLLYTCLLTSPAPILPPVLLLRICPASHNMFWYTKSGCPAHHGAAVEHIANTFPLIWHHRSRAN
jgi:hypothetical protein